MVAAALWMVPRDGATLHTSSWPAAKPSEMIEFTIYWGEYGDAPYDFDIEVATSAATDPDGTLADANVIDRYEAYERLDDIFSARTELSAPWLAAPGTYYWQAHSDDDVLPVRALTIVPAPPPDPPPPLAAPAPPYVAPPLPAPAPAPLSPSTVRVVVRRAIAAGTHRVPSALVYRCASAETCRPSWRDRRFAYRGTLRIASGLEGIAATFSGVRTLRSCPRRCSRDVTWKVSLR